jgi:hypothetical protein
LDPGWFITERKGIKAPDGQIIDAVRVRKITGRSEGKTHYAEKLVSVDELLSWQPQPEDDEVGDTIPRVPQHAGGLALAGAMQPVNDGESRHQDAADKNEQARSPRLEKIFAPLLDESAVIPIFVMTLAHISSVRSRRSYLICHHG